VHRGKRTRIVDAFLAKPHVNPAWVQVLKGGKSTQVQQVRENHISSHIKMEELESGKHTELLKQSDRWDVSQTQVQL
jgi:hypothetical protein